MMLQKVIEIIIDQTCALASIRHQKFCFHDLPTRGRAGLNLGDA